MEQVAIAPEKRTLADILSQDNVKAQFKAALPRHLSADRFARVAITALSRVPKLKQCSPQTFLKCLIDLSAMGLEPDGRNAHLIPLGQECQLIIDYKGLVDLAMRTGEIARIHADKVCENDEFIVDRGRLVSHKIDYSKPRGRAYAYYCLIEFKEGAEKLEVMTLDEVNEIRKRSNASSTGPWKTDFDEMAKKTVFRRASKWIRLSPEIIAALDKEYDSFEKNITPRHPEIQLNNPDLMLPTVTEESKSFTIDTIKTCENGDELSDFWRSVDSNLKAQPDVKNIFLAKANELSSKSQGAQA